MGPTALGARRPPWQGGLFRGGRSLGEWMNAPSTTIREPGREPGMTCWQCGAAAHGEHFCPACGKIQPLPPGATYFDFFGMPPQLVIENAALESRFHKLSWKLHPDNFTHATDFERNLSLQRSSELNDAYRALREPISRVEYLLAQRGMRREGAAKQKAPPELLEEVFELNEWLDELRENRAASGPAPADLLQRLEQAGNNFQEKLSRVDAELGQVFQEWDRAIAAPDVPAAPEGGAPEFFHMKHRGLTDAQQAILHRLNEILNRRSYIRNLVAGVQSELAGA
jgi:molecular chaperone HscB